MRLNQIKDGLLIYVEDEDRIYRLHVGPCECEQKGCLEAWLGDRTDDPIAFKAKKDCPMVVDGFDRWGRWCWVTKNQNPREFFVVEG